jgi:hypothetical protein
MGLQSAQTLLTEPTTHNSVTTSRRIRVEFLVAEANDGTPVPSLRLVGTAQHSLASRQKSAVARRLIVFAFSFWGCGTVVPVGTCWH